MKQGIFGARVGARAVMLVAAVGASGCSGGVESRDAEAGATSAVGVSSSTGSISVTSGAGGQSPSSCGAVVSCVTDADCVEVNGVCEDQGEFGSVCFCEGQTAASSSASGGGPSPPGLGCDDSAAADATVVLFGNYAGGSLTIDVDVDVPNLVLGVVSYEPISVTIQGAYAANVLCVHYAGYSAATSSIGGVDASRILFEYTPPATVSDACGATQISGEDEGVCGGCPTGPTVQSYFLDHPTMWPLSGTKIGFHDCRYWEYSGIRTISGGGSCAG